LHNLGIDAICHAASLGARIIRFRNGEVIAEVGEIEIVFDGKGDRVAQRNVQLSVADEALQARRVGQIEWRRLGGPIWRQRIVRVRQGHMKRLLWSKRGLLRLL
jgi:hypothetical protein